MPRGPYFRYLKVVNMPIPYSTLRRRQQQENNRLQIHEEEQDCDSSEDNQTIEINVINSASSSENGKEDTDYSEESVDEINNTINDINGRTTSMMSSDHEHSDSDVDIATENNINSSDLDSASDDNCDESNGFNNNVEFDAKNAVEVRQVLYPGCDITSDESRLLILSYAMRFDLSDTALEHLLLLIDSHLPSKQHGSLFRFLKNIPKPPQIRTHFYCFNEECQRLLVFHAGNVVTNCECGAVCDKNDLKNRGYFFLQIPLKEQLQKLLSDENIKKQLRWDDSEQNDVVNGRVYKNLVKSGALSKPDITLQFNTDGVQIFKSSNNELWPFQVCINELPYKIRKNNILLGGLWFGHGKPNMNTFLEPIVNELNKLHNKGFDCEDGTHIKVHTIISSVDSMARAPLQNIKTFRGKKGCSFCLHDGEEHIVGRGKTRVYRGDIGPRRTHKQHLRDTAQVMQTRTVVNGIKGPSILLLLQDFNIISSFVPDYMHCVLLGVVETMISWWCCGQNKDKPFYIGNDAKIDEIDNILLTIKPPSEVTRTPRSLHLRKYWKASEWKNFLLYYSIVCLKAVNFPKKYLDHWFLLVYSIAIFLQEHFSTEELNRAEAALKEFVFKIEKIYREPALMKFNFHLLLHIPQSVKDFGSLWSVSTFPYEHYNGVLGKMFQSSQAVPQQICKMYLRWQALKEMASELFQNNQTPACIKHLYAKLSFERRILYCSKVGESLRLLGVPTLGTLTLVQENVVENFLNESVQNHNIRFYKRFIFENVLYHIQDYQRMSKRINNIVQIENKKYMAITHVIVISTAVSNRTLCVLLGFRLYSTDESLCANRVLGVTSDSFASVVEITNECLAIYPQMITRKCVVTPYPDNRHKFCCFPLVNSVERD